MDNQNIGRDELAAMLGASHASDMVKAAATTTDDLNKGGLAAGAGMGGSKTIHYTKGGEDADISTMDRAQAAALVARKFAAGSAGAGGGGGGSAGATRHRASGKRKRMLQHHLLAGDLLEEQQQLKQQQQVMEMEEEENDIAKLYQKQEAEDEEEEDSFAMRADKSSGRRKAEAQVLQRKGNDRRRHSGRRGSSSSSSSQSESSDSSSSSDDDDSRNRGRRNGRRSRSNSSSSSEDEADIRRRRARERAKASRIEDEGKVTSLDHGAKENNGKRLDQEQSIDEPPMQQKSIAKEKRDDDSMSVDEKSGEEETRNRLERQSKEEEEEEDPMPKSRKSAPNRRRARSNSSSSSSSGSGSSSSSDSSSFSHSSSDESEQNIAPISISKPLFVPKSKRGTVAQVEAAEQKHEEAEKKRLAQAEKRAVQSRALVAEAVSATGKNGAVNGDNDGDEFDTGEAGGEFLVVPDDTDPTEEDSPNKVLAERDAWEVRELIRILRDVDQALGEEKERKELERRRALTDEKRLEEDKRSGRYRAPGEARRQRRKEKDEKGNDNYLQKFHHRGAFYMDEDTLAQAGTDDVRHRAAEYSRAATGEDKIDKSALPEVMQVKNFGMAGYSTKYKGLAKEDTTDKRLDFLPIRTGKGNSRNGSGVGGGEGRGGRGGERDR